MRRYLVIRIIHSRLSKGDSSPTREHTLSLGPTVRRITASIQHFFRSFPIPF